MDISVNGAPEAVEPGPDETLAELLRERLSLTGTKVACGTGACGSCTVLLDRTPTASCLLPAAAAEGRELTTVEGLGGEHPVQRAFAAHDALQCGYCTPGLVVSASAFVDAWRAEHGDGDPGRERIARALAGHLCRCGAYEGIQAAVAAACAGKHDQPEQAPPARVEAMDKITGRARYTTDVRLEDQWEGVIIRSTVAHARIGTVAHAEARLVDLLGPDRTVRYVGQPVAALAAPTLAEARAAARAVEVGYQPLPAVLDAEQALRPGAPAVHGDKEARKAAPRSNEAPLGPAAWRGNLRGPASSSWRGGTAARRIAAARTAGDPLLVRGSFSTAAQSHTALEPHAAVAHWLPGDRLELYVSTQAVARVAEAVAKRWRLAADRVVVHAEHVGGGFGGKVGLSAEAVAAIELSRALGRPVAVRLDRVEELTDGGHRPSSRTELTLLADASGGLRAMAVDLHSEGGVSVGAGGAALARYIYGNAPRRLRDYDTFTHLPPALPFRAPAGPQLAWALEQGVDEMAGRLGEDPISLRRRWDGNPKRAALYDWAAALPVWAERDAGGGSRTGRYRRGVGVAVANWLYLLDPAAELELSVEDGLVVARSASQDIGTGSRSVVADLIASGTGLPAELVRVELGRSDTVHGPASAASSGTPSLAPAALDAAEQLRALLAARSGSDGGPGAAEALKQLEGTRVTGRRHRDRRGYVTPFPLGGMSIGRGFAGAVNLSEVEVDTRLGTVRVLRAWAGIAAGRIYSERLARSQCEGGVIQGVGYALFEQRHTDPATGTVLTGNLEDYRLPGIADTPEITVHFHQEGWDHVTGRGVGLGEISTVAVAASLGNAVAHATGWRPRALPIGTDQLLEGIRAL